MTTDLLEPTQRPNTDTDLAVSDDADRAVDAVAGAWIVRGAANADVLGRSSYPTREIAFDMNRPEVDAWRAFVQMLPKRRWRSVLMDEVRHAPSYVGLATSVTKADRRRRYAELSRLLDEWVDDTSGFDERVAPQIEQALRETAPRHFPDE